MWDARQKEQYMSPSLQVSQYEFDKNLILLTNVYHGGLKFSKVLEINFFFRTFIRSYLTRLTEALFFLKVIFKYS